jgi:hypothetical protein
MEPFDTPELGDPLDLLHRFIPTPLRTRFRISGQWIVVETNDFALLPALPLETDSGRYGQSDLEWKLVRDPDAPGVLEEPLFLAAGNLTVVSMGTACLVGLDHELRQLLCFIGRGVDSKTFQEFLVPFFCRLTQQNSEDLCRPTVTGPDEKTDA